ncbi:MAG: ATP-binding protein [Chloroflexi bacterium]|nr:ATP-binding protein [Chloroflexota bacterium]
MADETMDYKSELEETQRALREITLMMEQSQGELSKLTQRNTAITSHLQQIQKQGGALDEITMAYDSALDAQQRLFVMRGQLEKLQNDKSHLEKYKVILERFAHDGGSREGAGQASTSVRDQMTGIEMIVNAQEAERQRLSRQMHDGPAQALSNFILQTEIAMRLLDVDPSQAKEELASLKASAMGTFQKVRNFIFELRPMMLDDLGLVPTLKKYAEAFKEQSGMEVNVTVSGTERRLEPYLEVMIFRAVQELLGNAARHSQASMVKVHLDLGAEFLRITVDDNGRGFDPETLKDSNNLGLKLIRERSEMLGGKFEIDSAIGSGAKISFTVQAKI